MKKINIIKKNYDIQKVIDNHDMIKNKYFYIYRLKNNEKYYRFAICVSKKIGNAVTRNKIKRQLKNIIDNSNLVFKYNYDYVIIIRKEINSVSYNELQQNLISSISKIID